MAKNLDNEIPECDPEIWEKGDHIATIINLKAEKIESIVKTAGKKSGQRMDWHYVGGRAAVRVLGDSDKAREYLEAELKPYQADGFNGYKSTEGALTVLPLSLLKQNRD